MAESCVFGKQSLGPGHCGPPALRRQAPPRRRAPLLPKLRGCCAEFLHHGSPDRLGMLYLPTCVGFGTGAPLARPRGFSRGHGCRSFAQCASSRVSASRAACLTAARPTRFHGGVQNPACVAFPVTARAQPRKGRYGNVRPSCIGYASRPRLSPRLTLGGLASPRKPWACGGRVSRSSLATHASILASAGSTRGRPLALRPPRNAPLPPDGFPSGPPLRRRA